MGFTEELWKVLPPFLRPGGRSADEEKNKKSDILILLQVAGEILDEAREKVFLLRRQAMVPTAKGEALDEHGRDRKMPRFPGESDDDYRLRLESAPDYYLMAGTKTGIVNVLESLGYPEAEFYPLYKEKYMDDPKPEYLGKWSQFVIRFPAPPGRNYSPSRHKILIENINKVKPPEGKLYAVEIKLLPRHREVFVGMMNRHGKKTTLKTAFPDISGSVNILTGTALRRSSRITLYQEVS